MQRRATAKSVSQCLAMLCLVMPGLQALFMDSAFSLQKEDNKRAEQEISKRMSMEHAIHSLAHMKNVSSDVVKTVQGGLLSRLSHLQLKLHQAPVGYAAVDGAKQKLNEMIHETAVKLDLELIRCSSYERSQLALLEKLRQDISTLSAALSEAAAEILRASSEISMYETKIPQAQKELAILLHNCKVSRAQYFKELQIVAADLRVMEKVMSMTECRTTLLLECHDPVTGKTFMQFGNDTLQTAVDDLEHPASKNLVNQGLSDQSTADKDGYPTDEEAQALEFPKAFLQKAHLRIRKILKVETNGSGEGSADDDDDQDDSNEDGGDDADDADDADDSDDSDDDAKIPDGAAFLQQPVTTPAPNSSELPPKTKLRRKCSIAGSPACPNLRERFMDIASGIDDKRVQLQNLLRVLTKKCVDGKARLKAKINLYEVSLKKEEMALAQATSIKMNSEQSIRLTQAQITKGTAEYNQAMSECRSNIDNFRTEKCGLTKIRGELYKMKGKSSTFTDCEVSDWTASECSLTCGGGVQKLSRTITTQVEGGAECPRLAAVQSCNEDACPVDCQMSDWSAWSSCSAQCGGGVRSKQRNIILPAQHGGDPCSASSMTESCHNEACDVDCELGEWTGWNACSKQCGGGSTARIKNVISPAKGAGKCPSVHMKTRMQMKPCNMQACANATVNVFSCQSKLDVILLLDGSGSVGDKGWEYTKKAAKKFVAAMGPDVQLGVLLFSGPVTYTNLWKCTGVNPGQTYLETDCGIKWISHFTTNMPSVASEIDKQSYPRRTTLTSLALSTANTELGQSRSDTQSVIVVLTDGKPLSEWKTEIASLTIRRKARLMWVPVGRLVSKADIRKWASHPVEENVVKIREYSDLDTPYALNSILMNMCPVLRLY